MPQIAGFPSFIPHLFHKAALSSTSNSSQSPLNIPTILLVYSVTQSFSFLPITRDTCSFNFGIYPKEQLFLEHMDWDILKFSINFKATQWLPP